MVQHQWAFHSLLFIHYSVCLHFSQTPLIRRKALHAVKELISCSVDHVTHSSIRDAENMTSLGTGEGGTLGKEKGLQWIALLPQI